MPEKYLLLALLASEVVESHLLKIRTQHPDRGFFACHCSSHPRQGWADPLEIFRDDSVYCDITWSKFLRSWIWSVEKASFCGLSVRKFRWSLISLFLIFNMYLNDHLKEASQGVTYYVGCICYKNMWKKSSKWSPKHDVFVDFER